MRTARLLAPSPSGEPARRQLQLQQTTAMMNQLRHSLGGMVVLAAHDPGAAAELSKALAS